VKKLPVTSYQFPVRMLPDWSLVTRDW